MSKEDLRSVATLVGLRQGLHGNMDNIIVLGIRVDLISVDELHEFIASTINRGDHAIVSNVNVQAINLCQKFHWLKEFFNNSEIVFCDGAGIQLGAKILRQEVPKRITYADWMWELCEYSEYKGFSLFFLGAEPGVAEQAADQLKKRFPGLDIRGCQHGYFDKAHDSKENCAVITKINASGSNILIVAFGMPLQEKWLRDNYDRLDVNITLTGGAAFDYVSGKLRRGPSWMTDHGFEWLARLIIEPRRLWARYVIGNPLFLWRVIKQKLGLVKLE